MAKVGSVRFNIEANSARMSKDLAAANRKLAGFRSQTKLNLDQIRNSFVGAFGGFIVLNAVTSAIKSLAGFELQMDKVQAISGATNRQMKALTDTALRLGRTTVFTASEIGKMEEELARLGFSTDKILDAADAITKLALVTSTDLGEAAQTMAGTLNGFNLEATESERVANVMAESFAKSALNMEKFTVGTANSSAIARVFGATVEENTARLGKLVDANIDASKAGTDLRQIYIELNANGLTYDEGMQKISTSTNKIKTATDLFGKRAAGAAVILSQLQGSVKYLTEELVDGNKEIEKMALIMGKNLATDVKILTSAYDGFILKMKASTGFISDHVQALTNMLIIFSSDNASGWDKFWAGITPSAAHLAKITLKIKELDKAAQKVNDDASAEDKKTINAIAQEQYAKAIDKTINGLKAMMQPISFHRLQEEISIKLKEKILKAEEEHTAELDKQTKAYFLLAKAQEYARAGIKSKGISDFLDKNEEKNDANKKKQMDFAGSSGFFLDDKGTKYIDVSAGVTAALDKNLKEIEDKQKKYVEATKQQVNELNQIVTDSITHGLGAFVETLASGGGIEAAFKGLLGVIGDGLVGLGKTLVAYGLALEAFKKAITNPFVAIGAGVAAIAIGSLFKKQASNMSGSVGGGGGAGGGSSGPSRSFIGGSFNQNRIEGQFTVRGSDLVYILGRQGQLDGRQKAG
jgi:hypothetical protein